MKLEVLVSTMHQNDMSIIKKMNLSSDALVINQCNKAYIEEIMTGDSGHVFRMISLNDRGLSRSRNTAIYHSDADICVLADDDMVYKENYTGIIKNAYERYPDADVIAFDVPSTNSSRPTSKLKRGDIGFLLSMKLASFQLTFKRNSILEHQIAFNELFGAGARYICGEENIWLAECLKKGLKIKYADEEIAWVDHKQSNWFQGFNEYYFITKGAMFYEMCRILWLPLILQFAIRKRKLYRSDISLLHALKYMIKGGLDYKGLLAKRRN